MFPLGLQSCDFTLYACSDNRCYCENVPFNEKWTSDMLKGVLNVYFDLALPHLHQKFKSPDPDEADDVE